MVKSGYEMVRKLKASEFARLNSISIADIETFSDSRSGAHFLNDDTELTVWEFWDNFVIITRNDNKGKNTKPVIVGHRENWKY